MLIYYNLIFIYNSSLSSYNSYHCDHHCLQNVYLIPVIVVITGVILLTTFRMIVVSCLLFSRGGKGNRVYGFKTVNKITFYFTILYTVVCYPQVINNEYISNISHISYEDPIQLPLS